MQAMDDMALLREYAANRSEDAFAELVSRRINFVHSAALRQVRDPNLAEEIAQVVFVILAQKADKISDKTVLAGWLFRTTRFVALAQIRAESKRRQREAEAQMQTEFESSATDEFWNQISPQLDVALAALGEKDRQTVLLRYFENKSMAEVGAALNAGEDTARKRVGRALEKLRKFFAKRGVASTTAILAGVLAANSVQAAPAGLAITIAAVSVKGPTAAATSTLALVKGTLKIMTYAKLKLALGVAAAALLVAGTVNVAISSMTDDDRTSVGVASEQEKNFANEVIKATADEDYQAFIADGIRISRLLKNRNLRPFVTRLLLN
jgi:RNA polymerase sigma factor (sigma-70 family)